MLVLDYLELEQRSSRLNLHQLTSAQRMPQLASNIPGFRPPPPHPTPLHSLNFLPPVYLESMNSTKKAYFNDRLSPTLVNLHLGLLKSQWLNELQCKLEAKP